MAGRQRSRTPSDSGGVGHPLLPPTPERSDFSLTELLENQAAQEREAAAVLPFAFGKCTNPMGPGLRQAIYSCLTCNPNEGKDSRLGGICSACSIGCHADHGASPLSARASQDLTDEAQSWSSCSAAATLCVVAPALLPTR